MSEHENTDGLTRPLINNIGGVIDQDAPSADQVLHGHNEEALSEVSLQKGDADVRTGDTGTVIPNIGDRIVAPPDE